MGYAAVGYRTARVVRLECAAVLEHLGWLVPKDRESDSKWETIGGATGSKRKTDNLIRILRADWQGRIRARVATAFLVIVLVAALGALKHFGLI
jgi:hypothetical protein